MGLKDDMVDVKKDVEKIVKIVDIDKPKSGLKKFKLPFKFKFGNRRKMKNGLVLVIHFRSNKLLEFKYCEIVDGLVQMDEETFKAFENSAVYHYKKYPVLAFFEWRLTPVGGLTELAESRVIGGEDAQKVADEFGVGDFAQKTIMRAIQKSEVDKEFGKKKGKIPIVWIVLGLGILLYFLAPYFGF